MKCGLATNSISTKGSSLLGKPESRCVDGRWGRPLLCLMGAVEGCPSDLLETPGHSSQPLGVHHIPSRPDSTRAVPSLGRSSLGYRDSPPRPVSSFCDLHLEGSCRGLSLCCLPPAQAGPHQSHPGICFPSTRRAHPPEARSVCLSPGRGFFSISSNVNKSDFHKLT